MDIDVALQEARSIFAHVIEAVDPQRLVQNALELKTASLVVGNESIGLSEHSRLTVIALGKAAPKMMAGAIAVLGQHIDAGLVITKEGVPIPETVEQSGRQVIFGGHPTPNRGSIQAGESANRIAEGLGPDDVLLMLISGGGSALMELPVDTLTLDDLITTTDSLLRQGANIHQSNAVRRRLSRLKGGKLAAIARPARIVNMIVSDVLGSPLSVIASGPTVPLDSASDPGIDWLTTSPRWDTLPESVRGQLIRSRLTEPDSLDGTVHSVVIADSHTVADAAVRAARAIGYTSDMLGFTFTGEAREFAAEWAGRARSVRDQEDQGNQPATCLVGAGELTVTVRGSGSGGRNSEMALAAARCINGDDRIAIASLATDGDDGTTGAAGGVVTGASCRIAREAGLDPTRLLEQNDSQTFLDATGGALRTGFTGTNVNDLYLAFINGPAKSQRIRRREAGDSA